MLHDPRFGLIRHRWQRWGNRTLSSREKQLGAEVARRSRDLKGVHWLIGPTWKNGKWGRCGTEYYVPASCFTSDLVSAPVWQSLNLCYSFCSSKIISLKLEINCLVLPPYIPFSSLPFRCPFCRWNYLFPLPLSNEALTFAYVRRLAEFKENIGWPDENGSGSGLGGRSSSQKVTSTIYSLEFQPLENIAPCLSNFPLPVNPFSLWIQWLSAALRFLYGASLEYRACRISGTERPLPLICLSFASCLSLNWL